MNASFEISAVTLKVVSSALHALHDIAEALGKRTRANAETKAESFIMCLELARRLRLSFINHGEDEARGVDATRSRKHHLVANVPENLL